IKSKELITGKKEILKGLKEINGVDFRQIALEIDNEFGSNGQVQTTLDFD
ncbi:hydrolase, partial [Halarcobacter bivalviorum]